MEIVSDVSSRLRAPGELPAAGATALQTGGPG